MERQTEPIDFTLSPAALSFGVDVRLDRAGDRWVARVAARGQERVALGPSPRHALTAGLEFLGASAVTLLLADLGLLEPSVRLASGDAVGAR